MFVSKVKSSLPRCQSDSFLVQPSTSRSASVDPAAAWREKHFTSRLCTIFSQISSWALVALRMAVSFALQRARQYCRRVCHQWVLCCMSHSSVGLVRGLLSACQWQDHDLDPYNIKYKRQVSQPQTVQVLEANGLCERLRVQTLSLVPCRRLLDGGELYTQRTRDVTDVMSHKSHNRHMMSWVVRVMSKYQSQLMMCHQVICEVLFSSEILWSRGAYSTEESSSLHGTSEAGGPLSSVQLNGRRRPVS